RVGGGEGGGEGGGRRGKGEPPAGKRQSLAQAADAVRSKIVATKEGGMITGEERLREYLGGLYGDVNSYDGKPTESQVARADVLGRQLEDVIKEFSQLTDQRPPPFTPDLGGRHLPALRVVPEAEWRKGGAAAGGGAPSPPAYWPRYSLR